MATTSPGGLMSSVVVSSSAELSVVLSTARAGDTVLLNAGAYTGISIANLNAGGNITIASADVAHQATLVDLQISGSTGLTFKNLEVAVGADSNRTGAIGVFDSHGIHFDHLNVHGSLDGTPTGDTDAFRIKNSEDVSVTNSELQQLRIAIGHGDSAKLNFSGNYIHDIGMDGIHGGGSSNVTIANNYFTNFYQPAGIHADAIQFYSGNIVKLVHDITITGNVVSQGVGQEIQGIFMRNEEAAGEFRNVKVSDNLILGGNSNGIAVADTHDLEITNNTVVSRSGQLSWINVESDDGAVVVSGNSAAKFNFDPNTQIIESGNQININSTDDGVSALRDWLDSHAAFRALLPGEVSAGIESAGDLAAADDSMLAANSFTLAPNSHNLTLTGVLNADGAGNALTNFLVGNSGNNHLLGYEGNDFLEGGAGDDVLDGGGGIDTASYQHATAGVVVSLIRWNGSSASGTAQNTGGAGKDTLVSIEHLYGSGYGDTLTGDTGANAINGAAGDDRITGGVGGDYLIGGDGADVFIYTSINDSTVAWGGRDSIVDFDGLAGDRISLSQIDAIAGTSANDAFKLVSEFTHVAGQVTFSYVDGYYLVQGDVNGDGLTDFALNVYSARALGAADFSF